MGIDVNDLRRFIITFLNLIDLSFRTEEFLPFKFNIISIYYKTEPKKL